MKFNNAILAVLLAVSSAPSLAGNKLSFDEWLGSQGIDYSEHVRKTKRQWDESATCIAYTQFIPSLNLLSDLALSDVDSMSKERIEAFYKSYYSTSGWMKAKNPREFDRNKLARDLYKENDCNTYIKRFFLEVKSIASYKDQLKNMK